MSPRSAPTGVACTSTSGSGQQEPEVEVHATPVGAERGLIPRCEEDRAGLAIARATDHPQRRVIDLQSKRAFLGIAPKPDAKRWPARFHRSTKRGKTLTAG